jgi:hypothetical protein
MSRFADRRLVTLLDDKLEDDTAERLRRNHDEAIRELQRYARELEARIADIPDPRKGFEVEPGGRIGLADGTDAAPSLYFTGATAAGLRRNGAGFSLVSGGVRRASISTNVAIDVNTLLSMPGTTRLQLVGALNLFPRPVRTSNTTMGASDSLQPCDTTGGAFAVTMKPDPFDGEVVAIVDVGGAAGSNAITISPNTGQSVLGAGSISTNYGGAMYMWINAVSGWAPVQ